MGKLDADILRKAVESAWQVGGWTISHDLHRCPQAIFEQPESHVTVHDPDFLRRILHCEHIPAGLAFTGIEAIGLTDFGDGKTLVEIGQDLLIEQRLYFRIGKTIIRIFRVDLPFESSLYMMKPLPICIIIFMQVIFWAA